METINIDTDLGLTLYSLEEQAGPTFESTRSHLEGYKYFGLLFCSSWCPITAIWCPILRKLQEELNSESKK
jgi:hypothetical protein